MQSPRSIVIASRLFVPEAGAAPFRLNALAAALDGAGHGVTVLTTRPPDGTRSEGRVRRWPVIRDSTGAVRGYLPYASFDIPLFFRLLLTRKLSLVVVEPPPTTGVVARLVCRLRRVPFVYFAADVTSSAARGIGVSPVVVRVLRRVEAWVLRGAAGVLAVSDGVRSEIIALGVNPSRVVVVGTGIDTVTFSPQGEVAEPGYPYLIYTGTMSEVHGAGVFIEAFALVASKNRAVRLRMLGQGVEARDLEAMAERLSPGRVDFPGSVKGDQVARWLRGAVAALASVRPERGYDFAFATKALVALSCGTPVIYSGVGPLRAKIAGTNLGWGVDWDPAQVAAAMIEALKARDSAARRQERSDWVENGYSLDSVARRASDAIDSILSTGWPSEVSTRPSP